MNARTPEPGSPIPSAPFDDLDLEKPEGEAEWDRRVMALSAARIAAERVRLECVFRRIVITDSTAS